MLPSSGMFRMNDPSMKTVNQPSSTLSEIDVGILNNSDAVPSTSLSELLR